MLNIRKASVDDVDAILKLVNYYAEKELLLRKSAFKVYTKLQNFYIAETEKKVVGCVSLVVLWKDLAEICSLAVDEHYLRRGIGKKLVNKCIEQAKLLKVTKIIALTYKDKFFEKIGFHFVDKNIFPRKLMWECLECPKLDECDELAYLMNLE
jgi:amino-acid N-acetyltransferase